MTYRYKSYKTPIQLAVWQKKMQSSTTRRFQLVLAGVGQLLAFTGYAILPPVLPHLAHRRGITYATCGWILAVFSLCQFISAPIFGTLVNKTGPKLMFTAGTFVCGVSTVTLGYLDSLPLDPWNNQLFIVLSLLLRGTAAVG